MTKTSPGVFRQNKSKVKSYDEKKNKNLKKASIKKRAIEGINWARF